MLIILNFSDCKIEENHGFLKYVCQRDMEGLFTYRCPCSNEFYKQKSQRLFLFFADKICPNDPHFYQACDKRLGGKVTNNEVLCENYLCYTRGLVYTSIGLSMRGGECSEDCENTNLNKVGCNDEKGALPSGKWVLPSNICNNVCDDPFTYGKYCMMNRRLEYVPPGRLCDGTRICDGGEDEEGCAVNSTTETSCRHVLTEEIVPVLNYTRCGQVQGTDYRDLKESHYSSERSRRARLRLYCESDDIARYQANCSDPTRVAVTCRIDGHLSTVSKYMICFNDKISVCDDHIDSSCYSTKSCTVHKHLLCDRKIDCNDDTDETNLICLKTTVQTCKRRVGIESELPIPISWLRDGLWDCEDGIDETADWPQCGVGKTLRYKSSKESECQNVFICRSGRPAYELLEDLCDGIENCGHENEVCSISSRSHSLTTTVRTTNRGATKILSFCHKGLQNLQRLIGQCVHEEFIYPEENIFGVEKTSVILPNSKQSCDFMYGEQYLYTSCTGHCFNASCPLRNIPRYEVCPGQFPDRVGTIVNNEYLIFLTKSFGTVYTNEFFVCSDNKKCIDYSKVCDMIYDCKDHSDEANCTNHYQCSSSRKLLPKSKQCDGQIDCADLSDECNEFCLKNLLEGPFLKGLSWLIGLLAILANLVIIGKSLATIKRCKTSIALINRVLIIMIALGDFLIGCHLFIIATIDAFIFKQEYCRQQITWITSQECSVIGVLSTTGSQISLFSMTGLSIVRIYGIWNSMKLPGELTMMKVFKIAGGILCLVVVSATIAVVPVVESFEDFFVNGVKFADGLKIFIGTPDKATVMAVIQAYHGRTKDTTLRWKTLIESVRDMFSHDLDYEDLTKSLANLDFYGNDGVCLFKYFVKNEDPQRIFVWSILTLNFICFVLISISYLLIGILSQRSSRSLASSKTNKQITQRNNRMNQRIAIIITTDFLCWVPFILICILHSVEVIDATPWYSIFSMVILPINSVINPLLYDDVVTKTIGAFVLVLANRVSNSTIFQSFRLRANPVSAEQIRLPEIED